MPQYYIKYEIHNGKGCYMIYKRRPIFPNVFFEKWKTPKSALARLLQLN